MSADEAILGCVLRSNNAYRAAAALITGDDFNNPTLGAVFDGMGRAIAAGGRIEATTVENYFPEWEVSGLTSADPWVWLDAGPYPEQARQIAAAIRTASLRRHGKTVLSAALRELEDAGKDPAAVIGNVERALVREQRSDIDAVPLTEILRLPDVQDWVIPGLLEAKDRLILTGHEGLGKTTLVRQMLIAPAAGLHPFTMERIEPIRALVVDAENTARQWMRAARWMVNRATVQTNTDPSPNIHMALSGRINVLDPLTLAGIHRLIDQHKPHVVFIGPLYRIAVHMNTDEQIAPVIAALDSLRDRGVALVVEAHAGHAIGVGGVRDVRPRGSSALLGWPEFGFGIRKDVSDTAGPNVFDFVAWRGAREERDWPQQLRRGDTALGDWPWVIEGGWS